MTKRNQHVVPHINGWAIKGAGSERATKVVPTQREAIGIARSIAQNQQSEMLIHRENGRIRERNSYGNDPHPPKG
jgi:stress response protein YsnF